MAEEKKGFFGKLMQKLKKEQEGAKTPAARETPAVESPKPHPHDPVTEPGQAEKNEAVQAAPTAESLQAYEKNVLEPAVIALLPPGFMELEGQQAMFKAICAVIPALDVFQDAAMRNVQNRMQTGGDVKKEIVGIHAMCLCRGVEVLRLDAVHRSVKEAEVNPLLHAWAAFHFYTDVLNASAPGRDKLLLLRKMFTAELYERKINVHVMSNENQKLQNLREQLAKTDKKDDALFQQRRRELGEALMEADRLYVITDKDVGREEPYLGADGRMEVFTTKQTASRFADHINGRHMAHVGLKTLEGKDIPAFFREQQTRALRFFRLDNGPEYVELELDAILPEMDGSLVFRNGAALRMMHQREIQYLTRFNRIPQEHRVQEYINSLASMAYTMRYNGYRDMGRGLLYVLCPDAGSRNDRTMYTPKAMARAKEMLEERNLPETALCEQGTSGTAIYEGSLAMMTAMRPGKEGAQLAYVMAFTDYQLADQMRSRFGGEHGRSGILAAVWDEVMGQAVQTDGVTIDMGGICYEIPKTEFAAVIKARESNGGFLFNLNVTDKANPPQDAQAD